MLIELSEWADRVIMPVTHGSTYGEAVQHGQEVLELLMNNAIQDGEPLPPPKTHVTAWSRTMGPRQIVAPNLATARVATTLV